MEGVCMSRGAPGCYRFNKNFFFTLAKRPFTSGNL